MEVENVNGPESCQRIQRTVVNDEVSIEDIGDGRRAGVFNARLAEVKDCEAQRKRHMHLEVRERGLELAKPTRQWIPVISCPQVVN